MDKINLQPDNIYELMANLAKINLHKKLAKYSFDKKFLNKRNTK